MNTIEKLQSVWNSNVSRNIEDVITQCLKLIYKAKEENSIIPLELENDIILSANYAIGYGSKKNEAKHIMELFYRNLHNKPKLSNIYRLASTAAGSLITGLTFDEQKNVRSANEIMSVFGIDTTNTRFKIIKVLLFELISLLKSSRPNYWTLETISFALIYISILQELNNWSKEDEKLLKNISSIFQDPLTDQEKENIERWKKSWSEKNEYFRFITLMIFNVHPKEDRWENLVKELLS